MFNMPVLNNILSLIGISPFIFNLADVFLNFGIILFIIDMLFFERKRIDSNEWFFNNWNWRWVFRWKTWSFLSSLYPEISRNKIQNHIKEGNVLINNTKLKQALF